MSRSALGVELSRAGDDSWRNIVERSFCGETRIATSEQSERARKSERREQGRGRE